MTAGPIIPIILERIVNREDAELVHFWEEVVPSCSSPVSGYGPLHMVSKSMFEEIWRSCSKAEFVCLACSTPFGFYSSEILALARRIADAGIRCYLLLPDPLPVNLNLIWLNGYRNRILVRTGKTAPMDFIVVDKGNHGCICFGSDPKGATQWTLDLTPKQCKGLFKVFLFLFWDNRNRENTFGPDFSPGLPSPHQLVCPGPGEFGEITSTEQEANITLEKIVYDPFGS